MGAEKIAVPTEALFKLRVCVLTARVGDHCPPHACTVRVRKCTCHIAKAFTLTFAVGGHHATVGVPVGWVVHGRRAERHFASPDVGDDRKVTRTSKPSTNTHDPTRLCSFIRTDI